MPRPAIPDALGMRRLKYDPIATDAERDATAALLRQQGRIAEAILLYDGRAEHLALVGDVKEATRLGSSFLLRLLERIGVTVEPEAWRTCAGHAEMKGRWYDALRCHEVLKDEIAIARVREKLPNFKIAVPENKK